MTTNTSTTPNDAAKTTVTPVLKKAEGAPPVAESEQDMTAAPVEVHGSRYITSWDGSRTLTEGVATVSRNGTKLYVKNRYGDYLIYLEFPSEDDAQAQMEDLNLQIDAYEKSQSTRPVHQVQRRSRYNRR